MSGKNLYLIPLLIIVISITVIANIPKTTNTKESEYIYMVEDPIDIIDPSGLRPEIYT